MTFVLTFYYIVPLILLLTFSEFLFIFRSVLKVFCLASLGVSYSNTYRKHKFSQMDTLIFNLRSASCFNAFTPSKVSLPWSVVLESRLIYACTGIYQASFIF